NQSAIDACLGCACFADPICVVEWMAASQTTGRTLANSSTVAVSEARHLVQLSRLAFDLAARDRRSNRAPGYLLALGPRLLRQPTFVIVSETAHLANCRTKWARVRLVPEKPTTGASVPTGRMPLQQIIYQRRLLTLLKFQ